MFHCFEEIKLTTIQIFSVFDAYDNSCHDQGRFWGCNSNIIAPMPYALPLQNTAGIIPNSLNLHKLKLLKFMVLWGV